MSNETDDVTEALYVATLSGADCWTTLATVRASQVLLDDLERRAVLELRHGQGQTWASIAAALGVTKQAAQQRFGN